MTWNPDTMLMRAMVGAGAMLMTAAVRMAWDRRVLEGIIRGVGVLRHGPDRVRLVDRVVTQLSQHRFHDGENGGEKSDDGDDPA